MGVVAPYGHTQDDSCRQRVFLPICIVQKYFYHDPTRANAEVAGPVRAGTLKYLLTEQKVSDACQVCIETDLNKAGTQEWVPIFEIIGSQPNSIDSQLAAENGLNQNRPVALEEAGLQQQITDQTRKNVQSLQQAKRIILGTGTSVLLVSFPISLFAAELLVYVVPIVLTIISAVLFCLGISLLGVHRPSAVPMLIGSLLLTLPCVLGLLTFEDLTNSEGAPFLLFPPILILTGIIFLGPLLIGFILGTVSVSRVFVEHSRLRELLRSDKRNEP